MVVLWLVQRFFDSTGNEGRESNKRQSDWGDLNPTDLRRGAGASSVIASRRRGIGSWSVIRGCTDIIGLGGWGDGVWRGCVGIGRSCDKSCSVSDILIVEH